MTGRQPALCAINKDPLHSEGQAAAKADETQGEEKEVTAALSLENWAFLFRQTVRIFMAWMLDWSL